jgi:hypothetical protein
VPDKLSGQFNKAQRSSLNPKIDLMPCIECHAARSMDPLGKTRNLEFS